MTSDNWMVMAGILLNLVLTVYHRWASAKELSETKIIVRETKEALTNGITTSVRETHSVMTKVQEELDKATALAEFARGVLAGRAQLAAEQVSDKQREQPSGAK